MPEPSPTIERSGLEEQASPHEQASPDERESQPPKTDTTGAPGWSGRSRLVAAASLFCLLVAAGLAYWWFSEGKGEVEEEVLVEPADCSEGAMRGSVSASALLDYATDCQDQPELAFNALRRCEERDDNGACLMAFGRCYDPLHYAEALCKLDNPQGDIAGGYYLRADALSYPGADEAHGALCSHLKQSDPQSYILAGCQ